MKIGVNCGHTKSGAGYGAVGIIRESEHTRLVGYSLMGKLQSLGVEVVDCTVDQAESQSAYLAKSVEIANSENLDLFVSIHFNASGGAGNGVEVYTYDGKQLEEALNVCNGISSLGFRNRGVKSGSGLYVVRKTKAKAMLIEVCFCDNSYDVSLYQSLGYERIADEICNAIVGHVSQDQEEPADNDMSQDEFMQFVGEIAKKDWNERRIILPSVVIAQAIKESGWGKSELAQNANALFGIKKNGWTGKVYVKQATEQRPDGSYYTVDNTEWRAYDNWEQSIIDHNDYIATRSTDGGKTLRYDPVIGCNDYVQACKYLQECGYATSLTYASSLIESIQKRNLTMYDPQEDDMAPDGYLWVVQAGAYRSLNNAKAFSEKLKREGIETLIKQYKVE